MEADANSDYSGTGLYSYLSYHIADVKVTADSSYRSEGARQVLRACDESHPRFVL